MSTRRQMIEAEKARLMRRAERQRGRIHAQTSRLGSAAPAREWLMRKLGLRSPTGDTPVTGSHVHPLLIAAAGLILPRIMQRHPVLRLAALGWDAYQLMTDEHPRTGAPSSRRRSLLQRFLS